MAPDPTNTTQPPTQTAPPDQQAPPQAQPLTAPNDSSAPVQQAPASAQPQQSQPAMVTNQPPVPKGVSADNPNAYHPSVQRAGVLRSIAEALAGGKRYRTTVDPNTGETTRTEVPLTNGDISTAIMLEALGGGLKGLSVPNGPGNLGRAAGAAGEQAMDQQIQAKQQQEQTASQDAARQYQTIEANMRMRNLALQTGRMDQDAHQSLVNGATQQLALLKDQSPESIAASNLSEQEAQDLQKYPIGDYYRLPDGVVPRLGPDGQPVFVTGIGRVVDKDTPGAVQAFDNSYSMIHRDAKIPATNPDGQPADWVKNSVRWGILPSNWLKASSNSTVPGVVAATLQHQVQTLEHTQGDLDHFYSTLGQQNPVDLHAAVKADPSLAKAVDKFQPFLMQANHNYGQALAAYGKVSSNAAGQVAALYGGPENIAQMDRKTQFIDAQNGYRQNGFKSVEEAQQVAANPSVDPDVRKAAQARIDAETNTKAQVAGAEAKAKYPYSAESRERAGSGLSGLTTPAANAAPNAQGIRTDYLSSLPATDRGTVQAIGEGRVAPPNVRTKEGKALQDQVSTAYPNYDGTKFQTYQKLRTDFTSGKSAQGLNALNTAISHLGTMYDNASLSSTLPGISSVERALGDKQANLFQDAQHAAIDEVGRAWKQGVVTDSEYKEWKSDISGWTPAKAKTQAQSLMQLLVGKINGYQLQLDNGTPSGVPSGINLISPEAKRTYQRVAGSDPMTGKAAEDESPRSRQATPQRVVPPGATPGRDRQGNIIGYRTADGKVVRF